MDDDPKYAWSDEPVDPPKVVYVPSYPSSRRIICEPVPGPAGTIRYVQDWCDLTHFG